MADNLEPSFGNFGIIDTTEMGLGSQELLNDLLAPETSTSDPDKITEIVKEVVPPVVKKPEGPAKGKEIVQKADGEELTGKDLLTNFLNDGDETGEEGDNDGTQKEKDIPDIVEESQPDEVSTFTSLAKDLLKLGVFTKDEEDEEADVKTPEEFLERFNTEKKKGAIEIVNNFTSRFGEDYQNAFEAIFMKGVDPKEYFATYNTITDFAELDLAKEENQIAVIRQSLTDQGMDPEDVKDEIDQIKSYGDLESKAVKYHKVLIKKGAAKLQEMEQQSERDLQQKTAVKNQYVNNVRQIIEEKLKLKEYDGIPLNPKLANELHDFLLVDKYKTVSGETLTDFDKAILELKRPENHAQKVKVGLLLKILEKDPTLSTIQKSGITKKSDQLFGEVVRQKSSAKPSATSSSQQNSKSWFQ